MTSPRRHGLVSLERGGRLACLAVLLAAALMACAKMDESVSSSQPRAEPAPEEAMADERFEGEERADKNAPMAKQTAPRRAGGGGAADIASLARPAAPMQAAPASTAPAEPDAAPARSWFPETFLFAPLVVTDEGGRAMHAAKIPDRLTTYRVLALAHSRAGSQAGAVTSFRATLPVYVDPVVPPILASGDRALLPIQIVNTTDAEVSRTLRVRAEGSLTSSFSRAVRIPARGSLIERVPVEARRPGSASLTASLGASDAVERSLEVRSIGRPGSVQRSGTLAAPRELTITLPPDVEPGSIKARLTVFPGALGVLRAELAAAPSRSGRADDAYLLLLAARARSLAAALGADLDEEGVRRLRLLATQRALRHARVPSLENGSLFTVPARSHTDPLLARLGERLVGDVARSQRPDGTFTDGPGWPLPRVLVATAEGVRAATAPAAGAPAPSDARTANARLRARVAFERFLPRVEDAYTAAAILSARVVEGEPQRALVQRVLDAVSKSSDGSAAVMPGAASLRSDGARPSAVEVTALAVLALGDQPEAQALLPDLAASILAAYRPGVGFGDGRTNLVALLAVTQVFKDPLPTRIAVKLSRVGETITEGVLEGERLTDVLSLTSPTAYAAEATYRVEADPPVPGLAYHLELTFTVPWLSKSDGPLELAIELPGREKPKVGRPLDVTVRATAPGGVPLELVHRLPAGVLADQPSLERLVQAGTLESFATEDGAITLRAPRRRQGDAFIATYRVMPTLAGRLHTLPSSVRVRATEAQEHFVPTPAWVIAP